MKRDGWEGGHRIPFIVRWPGKIPAGTVSRQTMNITDVMATLASVVGVSLPDAAAEDSYDMLPVFLGQQNESQQVRPYNLTQSYRGEFQIQRGPWKFMDHKGSGGNNYSSGNIHAYELPELDPTAPGQLYNLETDPGETTNLYSQRPDIVTELKALLAKAKSSGRSAPLNRVPMALRGKSDKARSKVMSKENFPGGEILYDYRGSEIRTPRASTGIYFTKNKAKRLYY